jgi:cytochrome c oxidase assembly protein subunit 15
MPQAGPSTRSAGGGWPHRLALLTLCATLFLIVAGALVTSLGAGLAVPDWPTTFGHDMFTFPLSKRAGGILVEHSHRLMGSLVGILTIFTAGALLWRDERRWMRALGVAALALVILQGVLGGMRVVLVKLDLAIVHACAAQLFFGLMAGIALFTSRAWARSEGAFLASRSLVRLAALAAGTLYLQTALGAYLRHTGERADAHLMFAVVAAAAAAWAAARAFHECGGHPAVARAANLVWIFLAVQIALGLATFVGKYTEWADAVLPYRVVVAFTAAHVAGGSLLFAAALVLAIWLRRFQAAAPERARSGALPGRATA